jgi:hypothetical protein
MHGGGAKRVSLKKIQIRVKFKICFKFGLKIKKNSQMTRRIVVIVAPSGPVSSSSQKSHESHGKYLISSVSTPIDHKISGQAPNVPKMQLHENHSHTCLTTLEIERS